MNNNILISAGILRTYWEHSHRDTLDLIMPFLKCSIYKTTCQGEEIQIDVLTNYFREEYGYNDIPFNVICLMLKRLSPSIVTVKNKKYYFTGNIDNEVADFEKKKITNKEHREKVIEALQTHLSMAFPRENFTAEFTGELLYTFFSNNGLCLVKNTENLIGLRQKDNKKEYEIARFIMNEYRSESTVFDYIYAMVQGFFVSTAIYIPQASTSLQARLKGVSCYIDTRIIINALGMHLPAQVQKSATEFLQMLKDGGAKLFCFRHNYDEIESVLKAYRWSLLHANHPSANTLEAFDAQGYSAKNVDEYLLRLTKRIEALGITIVDTPEYDNSYKASAYIDVKQLEETFRAENDNNYRTANAVQADAQSVAAIMLLRNGEQPLELEKAKHIFITSSNRYCSIVERFLNPQNHNTVPVAYSEMNLSALLWLRNYSAHKDYPKNKLIENAMMTLDVPSGQFLNDLFKNIDILQEQGELTQDEAAILRVDSFIRKSLLHETKGDSSELTDDSLLAAKERLKNRYLGEEKEATQLNYDKYIDQKRKHDEALRNAAEEVLRVGDEKSESTKKKLTAVAQAGLVIFAIVFGICSAVGFVLGTWEQIAVSLILLAVDVWGFIDLLHSKMVTISKWINNYAQHAGDIEMEKKRAEYDKIFGSLTEF